MSKHTSRKPAPVATPAVVTPSSDELAEAAAARATGLALALDYAKDDAAVLRRARVMHDAVHRDGLSVRGVALAASIERARLVHPDATDASLVALAGLPAYAVSKSTIDRMASAFAWVLVLAIKPSAETVAAAVRAMNAAGVATERAELSALVGGVAVLERPDAFITGCAAILVSANTKRAAGRVPSVSTPKGGVQGGTPTGETEDERVPMSDEAHAQSIVDALRVLAGMGERVSDATISTVRAAYDDFEEALAARGYVSPAVSEALA